MIAVRGNNARQFDQFFTKKDVANECVKWLADNMSMPIADFDLILEPSCGAGAFVRALETVDVKVGSHPNLLFVDIDARDASHRADFLNDDVVPAKYNHANQTSEGGRKRKDDDRDGLQQQQARCLTIGNPPFGKNSSLAVAFFNRAAVFSAVIAFIVPRTFMKASVHDRLDRHFVLLKEYEVRRDGFTLEAQSYSVPCVLQVWIHTSHLDVASHAIECPKGSLRPVTPRLISTPDFTFVTPQDQPDIAVRRVGVNAGRLFFDNPHQCSVQSHLFIKVKDRRLVELVKAGLTSLNLEHTKTKFETAGCPSISKNELCNLYMKAFY